ncbi:tetratricopeptide repeat protein [uncultured Cytophaga sp.]|uniref:tetratricopeptide repeat protein n=1 Tax=uncultured Cytophaga sp. TaxID=160238 RepID=UPI00260E5FF4|nr:tetratricopeptide repeat protein [uncultured Cytophaga sp.]
MIKKSLLLFYGLMHLLFAQAQNTAAHNSPDRKYYDGMELYDKQKYVAAKQIFQQYIQEFPMETKAIESEYYVALCALNLFNDDAEYLFNNFVAKYPNHIKSGRAGFDLGNFFYNNKKYDKAIQYYSTIDETKLSSDEKNEYNFKSGYSSFTKRDFATALEKFNKCKNQRHKYTPAANYYAGYMEFKNGDYDDALTDLNRASESNEYKPLVAVLIANVYYRQGKYDELIPYAEKVIKDKSAGPNTNDVKLILADAYFFKEDFNKATPLFKDYLVATGTKSLSPDMKYRIGFSSYKSTDYKQAVDMLQSIANDKDSLGQSSAYIMGLSYLKSNNKPSAALAFELAQRSSFSPIIKEESMFLYGKVAVDLGRFTDATSRLKLFLDTYPKTNHTQEASELLSESFLGSRNYDEALTYIENLKYQNSRINTTYQRIAYYKAVELINKKEYTKALVLLDKSSKYSFDKTVYVNSFYWKGECFSLEKQYEQADNAYSTAIDKGNVLENNNVIKAYYGLGYAYYYQKKWNDAIPQFVKFLTLQSEKKGKSDIYYRDAELRLADLYFVTRRFPEAIKYYDLALTSRKEDEDYILFQKASIQYLTKKTNEAYSLYTQLINKFPNSTYYDNALMQRCQLDLEGSKYESAIEGYTKIINKKEDLNGLKPLALQKRAMSHFNLKEYDKAIADNKRVLENYPTNPVAYSSLLSVQEMLNIQDKSEEFAPILVSYKEANPEGRDLKEVEFIAAQSLYSSQKYSAAITAFNSFIKQYPNHSSVDEAKYFLADSYYRTKDYKAAKDQYVEILAAKNQYYKKALQRVAEISYLQNDVPQSITYYNELQVLASSNKEKTSTWLGLMTSYFDVKQLDSSNIYADKVINSGSSAPDAQNKAVLYKGKIAYQAKDLVSAQDYFVSCLNGAKDINAAEAQYLLAKIQYDNKQYKQSIETLYDFNNTFSAYDYWLGKSFLLIAENFVAKDELFQAKETLASIIDKSPNEEIKKQAKERLEQIKKIEATNNQSKEGVGNE